jgi:hypothetical protein
MLEKIDGGYVVDIGGAGDVFVHLLSSTINLCQKGVCVNERRFVYGMLVYNI